MPISSVQGSPLVTSVFGVRGDRSTVALDSGVAITISPRHTGDAATVTIRLDPKKLTPPLATSDFEAVVVPMPWSSAPAEVERLADGRVEVRVTTTTPSAWLQAAPRLQVTSPAGPSLVTLAPTAVTIDDTASLVAQLEQNVVQLGVWIRSIQEGRAWVQGQLRQPEALLANERADLTELAGRVAVARAELSVRRKEVERALEASSPALKMIVAHEVNQVGAGVFVATAEEAELAMAALKADPAAWEAALRAAEPKLFRDSQGLGRQSLTALPGHLARLEAQHAEAQAALPGILEARVARLQASDASYQADLQRAAEQQRAIDAQLAELATTPSTTRAPTRFVGPGALGAQRRGGSPAVR